jgi:hypothetical protein
MHPTPQTHKYMLYIPHGKPQNIPQILLNLTSMQTLVRNITQFFYLVDMDIVAERTRRVKHSGTILPPQRHETATSSSGSLLFV